MGWLRVRGIAMSKPTSKGRWKVWGVAPNPHPNPLPEYRERGKEVMEDLRFEISNEGQDNANTQH